MENTKPKEILENIINVMEKTNVDDWEIDKLVVVLNYINELETNRDKAIEYINFFEEDNPDYNSSFHNDYWCKNGIGFEDLVENTTKILRGEE